MKHSLLLSTLILLIFGTLGCRIYKSKKPADIKKITIFYSEEYCGGAAPPDAIVNELATIKPLKNKEVEIYLSDDINSIPMKFIADSSGTILLPGNIANTVFINLYTPLSFYKDAEKDDKQFFDCYKNFIKKNFIQVNLSENQNEFSITSLIKCNPCLPPAP